MNTDLVRRYAAPVPRYTSYPTANHFSTAIGAAQYIDWLAALPPRAPISLYLHIPFCQAMCWYCACNTKAVQRYEPVARYVDFVLNEIGNVATLLPGRLSVAHMHWGGGSPSILEPADIARLAAALQEAFDFKRGAEVAVEVDPRHLRPDQVHAFAAAGINRVSFGVQDFDPKVQAAIGREQGFDLTRRAVELFRGEGVRSVNVDLVYGLPHQTEASLTRTIADVLALAPDRIAVFGYAHLPQRMKSQRLIDETALPGMMARFTQSALIADLLVAGGYRRIGLDHFAREADTLAGETLRRNFQGYTTDDAETLIGFGASAIGRFPDGYVQNAVTPRDYERAIAKGGLAIAKGIALDTDDRVRGFAIERLMCDFKLSIRDLVDVFGEAARPVLAIAADVAARDEDGLVRLVDDGLEVTDTGRPFVRTICAAFDRYLPGGTGRHSSGV